MAYIKKIWKDYPDTTTPIIAADMNNIENGIEAVDTALDSGWISLTGTFTYSSADSPTFVMTTSVDLTGIVGLGMRIKLTQTTTKYFIVTAITNNSITMYGGTDYTLVNDSISNVYYSMLKAPFGFPMNPDIWTLAFGVDTSTVINNPVSGTWYNMNTYAIPVGLWKISYLLGMYPARSTTGTFGQKVTLSTTNNGETNTALSSFIYMAGAQEAILQSTLTDYMLNVTAQTNYYLNIKTDYTGLTLIRFWDIPLSRVYFICGYL